MEGNSNKRSYIFHMIPDDAWKLQDARRRYQLARFLEKRSTKQQGVNSSQDSETEVQNHEVTVLDDLLFNILILVPAESLFRSQFVCEKWCNLINSSIFIRSHAQQSETVLICRMLTFSIPTAGSRRSRAKPKSYFHVLNLDGGGPSFIESSIVEPLDILATCDGLVLAAMGKKKKMSLILTNPVTRKRVALPSVTEGYFRYESFGVAFCKEMNTYKIVHLFGNMLKQTGCNIMSVCEKKWTQVEAPDYELLMYTRKKPVPIGGSLSWTPMKEGCDYFLSLDLNDEKFVCKKLPVSCSSWDRLLEIEGNLGFVTNLKYYAMHVWIMVSDGGSAGENWIKKYSVGLCVDRMLPIPVCCLKDGKGIVGEIGTELVVEKYEGGEMEVIETGELQVLPGMSESFVFHGWMEKEYIPHRNTLASII